MSSPAGHAIFEAVRASLRLVNSSSGLFTIPQLLAIEGDLRETLAVISGKVQAEQSGGGRTIIDCESSSDEEKEDQKEDIRAASGDFPDPALVRRRSLTGITGSDGGSEPPLPIPGPYATTPPKTDKLPDCWYVVDRGTEVGIFSNNESSTRATIGVVRGHRVEVKTWVEAAALYNELYHKGDIVRVRA